MAGGSKLAPFSPSRAAFNLRDFSKGRQRLGTQRALSESQFPMDNLKERSRQHRQAEKLEAQFQKEVDERGVEKTLREREERAAVERRQQLKAAREEREEQEQMKRWHEWLDRKEKREEAERQARELERLEREAEERRRMEEEERERKRKAPKVCHQCNGTGKCPWCNGQGGMMQDFLATEPRSDSPFPYEFGRKRQGCVKCGGLSPGIGGTPKEGTGKCTSCDGHGKIWPSAQDPTQTVGLRRFRSSLRRQSSSLSLGDGSMPMSLRRKGSSSNLGDISMSLGKPNFSSNSSDGPQALGLKGVPAKGVSSGLPALVESSALRV